MNASTYLSPLVTFALLSCTVVSSSAAVFFTDNFDVTVNGPPNDEVLNPGRQGGSLSPLTYITAGNVQTGNLTTLPPSPGSDLGDELLVAFGSSAYIDRDFSDESLPLQITFRGLISSIEGEGTPDWVSFNVGNGAGVPFVTSASISSILFRANGDTQLFDRGVGTTGGSGFAPGLDVWSDYMVILSDTAGTGSAFTGNGSRVDYYINGALLGTFDITQLTSGEGYLGFSANRIVGYDNLQVATVPEPSSVMAGLSGLAGLAFLRRRK